MRTQRLLALHELQNILDECQYKPDWHLTVLPGNFEGPWLCVWAPIENSYQPDKMTTLDIHSQIPHIFRVGDEDIFKEWIIWRLSIIEQHEAREFFRDKDGKPFFDPHGPDANIESHSEPPKKL